MCWRWWREWALTTWIGINTIIIWIASSITIVTIITVIAAIWVTSISITMISWVTTATTATTATTTTATTTIMTSVIYAIVLITSRTLIRRRSIVVKSTTETSSKSTSKSTSESTSIVTIIIKLSNIRPVVRWKSSESCVWMYVVYILIYEKRKIIIIFFFFSKWKRFLWYIFVNEIKTKYLKIQREREYVCVYVKDIVMRNQTLLWNEWMYLHKKKIVSISISIFNNALKYFFVHCIGWLIG